MNDFSAERRAIGFGAVAAAFLGGVAMAGVFPGTAWEARTPAQLGLDTAALNAARDYIGGRGCVVRHGYVGYTWGDQAQRQDIASASKPWFSTFLFMALETGRIASLDDPVVNWEPCLNALNPALGYKDRNITLRHMANQISCYGVSEPPGTAFDYNDWQMALFWDTLFLRIYGATYANVDTTVLRPMLTDILQCQDNPTMVVFGTGDRAGRIGVSVRDFARFGLLYLNQGNWDGTQIISQAHAVMATTSPLPNSIPRTSAVAAQICPGARTLGSGDIPDNQTDHDGSYSWLWWTNGVNRSGGRRFAGCPLDTYGAFGHANGQRAVVVIPSLDMVISWNDTTLGSKAGNPGEAIKRVVAAVLPETPLIMLSTAAISRTVDYGQNLEDEKFTVSNVGIGVLQYQLQADQAWLSLSPTTGSSTGEADPITIHYAVSALPIGNYSATIQVDDSGSSPPAGNSPQVIAVSLSVRTVLPDLDGDGDVDQEDFGIFQICYMSPAEPAIPAACQNRDFTKDGVVNQSDANVLLGCLSGPGVIANRSCDDAFQ